MPENRSQRPSASGAPPGRKHAELPPRKASQHMPATLIPFVFMAFITGFVMLAAAPILYVYEIVLYAREDKWPGWSVRDALNHYFFEDRPMMAAKESLRFLGSQTNLINIHGAIGDFLNYAAYLYLESSIIVIFLITGGLLFYLSIRIAVSYQKG